MTDLATLASDISSAITLASRSIPHVDRIDRRKLMDARDRLDRFHATLLADMKRIVDGPFGTVGCWQTREPGVRDIIRDVERIARQAPVRRGIAA